MNFDHEDYLEKTLRQHYKNHVIDKYKKSNKLIDLHMHTNASDGDLSPGELVCHCIKNKIGIMAITDHDTIDGIKELSYARTMIFETGIKLIPGIELTASVPTGRMHILGYEIDIENEKLKNKLAEIKDISVNSVLSVLEHIKRDYGIMFSYDDIKKLINKKSNIGRTDIASLCVKYGYSKTNKEAFDKYLIDAYDKVRKYKGIVKYDEIINIILESNGIPVLAHPKSLELSEKDFIILLYKMIKVGLKGIECYHPSFTTEESRYYLDIAEKYNLLVSGGTDFNGNISKPEIEVGIRKGDMHIKQLSILKHGLKY